MPTVSPRPAKVLVVDDTPFHRTLLRLILEEAGYQVVEADDGLKAITTAYQEQPDIIVCDVVMPELSGYQVCRFLKNDSQMKRVPIILQTDTALARQDKFWGLKSGADRYVAKESVKDLLLDEVSTLLAQTSKEQSENSCSKPRRKPQDNIIRSEMALLLDKLLFRTTLAHEVRRLSNWVNNEERYLSELVNLVESLSDFTCMVFHLAESTGNRIWFSTTQPLSPLQVNRVREVLSQGVGLREISADCITPSIEKLIDLNLHGDFKHHCLFPLCAEDQLLGSLAIFYNKPLGTHGNEENLELLALELAPVVRLLLLYQENHRLSISDGLTRLHNFRHLKERLEIEWEKFEQTGSVFTIMLLDMDNFKQVNDQRGHAMGDAVLLQTAEIMRSHVRKGDLIARYGGDEFVIILPDTGHEHSARIAERIRERVASAPLPEEYEPSPVTMSIGLSQVWSGCSSLKEVLKAADEALYSAKHAGRNTVRIHEQL